MDGEAVKEIVKKEDTLLKNWLEHGKTEGSFAIYGTKSSFVSDMLREDHVPSYPLTDLPYQQQIAAEGKHLYYMLPRVGNMFGEGKDPVMNKAVATIIMQFHNRATALPRNLQEDSIRNVARMYALDASLEEAFYRQTGMRAKSDEVNYMASKYIPKEFAQYAQETDDFNRGNLDESMKEHSDPERLAAIEKTVGRERLRQILPHVINKRGVLVYLNRDAFAQGTILPGHESEQEIMLVTQQPLSLSAVAGIEALSEYDKADLRSG